MGLKDIIYIDWETYCELDIKKVGAAKYIAHPSLRPLCLGYSIYGEHKLVLPDELPFEPTLYEAAFNPDVIFCAHNMFFDRGVWNKIMVKMGYPEIPVTRAKCTMAKCFAHSLPADLKSASIALGLVEQKDMEGHEAMKFLCKPRPKIGGMWTYREQPDAYEKMYAYCLQDLMPMIEIDELLRDLIPQEQRIWELDQEINLRGIQIDVELVRKALDLIAEQKTRDTEDFIGVQEDVSECGIRIKPSQRAKFKAWLSSRGYTLKDLKAATLDRFMLRDDLPDYIRQAVLLYRSAGKSSLAKYATMLRQMDEEGVIREIAQYHGAHTGRFGHRGVQFGNLARPDCNVQTVCDAIAMFDYEDFAWLYDDVSQALSSAIRGMVIPHERL